MTTYSAHGLVIGSQISLSARTVAAGPPDLTICLAPPGRVPPHGTTLPGRELAFYEDGVGSSMSVSSLVDGPDRPQQVQVCFHGHASAVIDLQARTVEVSLPDGADPGLASVFVSGAVVSVALTLLSHPVLHASAVTTAGASSAVAFVGRSGMGKSTATALLCRDGASLLADDVLRTDKASDGRVVAWPGASAIRLRENAAGLGSQMEAALDYTADGRLAVKPRLSPDRPAPLAAVVVPAPDREASVVRVERIDPLPSVLALASFPRILGWSDPRLMRENHQHVTMLAETVPVLVARIPWGPPFGPGLGSRILEGIEAFL